MSFEDHWPNNRQHQWKPDGNREACATCGVIRSVWHNYPCGSHPWNLHTQAGTVVAGISENGGFWPVAWPDNLDEERAVEAMHEFFREHGDEIKLALKKPEVVSE